MRTSTWNLGSTKARSFSRSNNEPHLQPVHRMNFRFVVYLLTVALLVTAVLFSPSWGNWLWLRTLHDFAHGPVFGFIAIVMLMAQRHRAVGEARTHYLVAIAVAVFLGGATELIQWFTYRDPSWKDFRTDVIGVAAFVSCYALFDSRIAHLRRALMPLVAITLSVLLWPVAVTAHAYYERNRAFPLIFDLNRGIGMYFITTRQVNTRIETMPAPWSSESALRVDFLPGKWQGIELREPPSDWREFDELLVDLVNPTSETLRVVVRVDDEQHNWKYADRYNGNFDIASNSRAALRIPIEEIRTAPKTRELDLGRVARVVVFRRRDSQAPSMYVSRMELARSGD